MMTTAKSKQLPITAVLALILPVSTAQNTSFPNRNVESKSPNRRYIIKNIDADKQPFTHSLMLFRASDGTGEKIYDYRRHVDLLWSPSSNAFVVNDYEASNSSHPVLFLVKEYSQPIDLREELRKFLKTGGEEGHLFGNQHMYFVAERWITTHEISCLLTAYGDTSPSGTTRHYVYVVGHGFRAGR